MSCSPFPPAREWWLARGRDPHTCRRSKCAVFSLNSEIKRSLHRVLGTMGDMRRGRPVTCGSRALNRRVVHIPQPEAHAGPRSRTSSYRGYRAAFQAPGSVSCIGPSAPRRQEQTCPLSQEHRHTAGPRVPQGCAKRDARSRSPPPRPLRGFLQSAGTGCCFLFQIPQEPQGSLLNHPKAKHTG